MLEKQENFIQKVKNKIDGKNMKYFIFTMGCQLNENDSEKISGMLTKMGYTETENIDSADIIIYNLIELTK